MAGRAHLYEGYSPAQVVYGVRVLHSLGVRSMVFTNAAGGINLELERGGLVLISDHINLQGVNPLTGPNDDSLGPRFPDMSEAYSRKFREVAKDVATELCVPMREGVYAAMPGPSYETPAEIRYLRTIGADVVGMSTVLEVIAANHMGMKSLGISCVTNMAAGVVPLSKIDHEEVSGNRRHGARHAGAVSERASAAVGRRRIGGSRGMSDPLTAAALLARENAFAPFSKFLGGRGAGGQRRAHPHRLQRGKRHLRADDVRRAGGHFQGDFRRRAQVSPRGRGRR